MRITSPRSNSSIGSSPASWTPSSASALVLVLAFFCYRALSPFLTLLIWSLILAVALYPLHDAVARKLGGRHGLAATLIAILGLALIVAPTAVLMNSLGEWVHQFVQNVQSSSLEIPAPVESVATCADRWPAAARHVVAGACRSAGAGAEPAAAARRHREAGARLRGGHRRRPAAVSRGLHHCRHRHGVRRGGCTSEPRDLPAHLRPGARRGTRQAVHRDDSRRRPRRDWRRVHPGESSSACAC